MKEQELLLRFFALYYDYQSYKKVLKAFLNSFMSINRNLELYPKDYLSALFNCTIELIQSSIGNNTFRTGNRLNAAIFDAVMIGITKKRLEKDTVVIDKEKLKEQYDWLLTQADFLTYVESSTSSESSVKGRIEKSIQAFKDI